MKLKKQGGEASEEPKWPGTKTLDQILKEIQKEHGSGVIRLLGDSKIEKVDVIPTGSYLLDRALIIGGLPRGRVVELYGAEGGGKTSLSLHAIANVQKRGGRGAFVDAEHALDLALAQNLSVNISQLVFSQPDFGEQALDVTLALVDSGLFEIVVVDSVAALVPKAELEGDMEDQQMGAQARMMGKALRKIVARAGKTNTCVVFINQLRSKIGGFGFGDPDVTPGGRSLKFAASIRIDIRRIGSVKQGEDVIGNRVKIKVVKNKLAPPFRELETELIFGKGISRENEILEFASNLGIVEKSGSWYAYGSEKLGQGKIEACKLLTANPHIVDKILVDIAKQQGEPDVTSSQEESPVDAIEEAF